MRRILTVACDGAALAATLDEAPATSGLLIVSGGNEIRMGAHRGMAMLAREIAAAGYPVFRFDRRGIGDSAGENGGFETSGPDIGAAISAFRGACPNLGRIVAFGNCDAASALLLHRPQGIDALVLGNLWVIEDDGGAMPPPAAIKARYLARVRDPKAWLGMLTGATNLRKLASGLIKLIRPRGPSSLARRVAGAMAAFPGPVTVLLASRDATAIAFADAWEKPEFAAARARTDIDIVRLDSPSHSFASDADHATLVKSLLRALDDSY
jgi:exosortase A-associated hydrolase 1